MPEARRGRRDHLARRETVRLCAAAALFCVLLVSRRPAVLLHAQLWGDDGFAWYPDAYALGIRCLLMPANGYLNTLQRLVALAVQPFPLSWVPTLFCLAAMLVQIAPSLLLASDRMAAAWPHRWSRWAFALLLIGLPDLTELFLNLTNAQWHLGLFAFLVLVSAPPKGWSGRLFDGAVLALAGLSGPFGAFLIPIVLWQMLAAGGLPGSLRALSGWRHLPAIRALLVRTIPLGIATSIQIYVYSGAMSQPLPPLAAGPRVLARIIALKVVIGAELGMAAMARIERLHSWTSNVLPIALATTAAVLAIPALILGPRLLRQFFVFASMVMISGLLRPHVSPARQWWAMALPLAGSRYFWLESIAWLGIVLVLANQKRIWLRVPGLAFLLTFLFYGLPYDWHTYRWPADDFVHRARVFELAPIGTTMSFPSIPTGIRGMTLTKLR